MPDTSKGNAKKPMKQPVENLSKAMGNLSVTADYSNKAFSPKNLSDMPVDVVGLIIERSDYKEQLILRKVSKPLRSLVDKQKPAGTRLHFNCYPEHIHCFYNQQSGIYVTPKSNQIEDWMEKEKNDGRSILIVKDDYKEIAFEELAYLLKNPRLQLETLSLKTFNVIKKSSNINGQCLEICRVLNGINHQLSAKEYEIQWARPSKDLQILPFLKPGVLEKISVIKCILRFPEKEQSETFEKISNLEQWKQAKELKLMDVLEEFPLEYAIHFKRFRIDVHEIFNPKLTRIRDFLSQLDEFEYCTITCRTVIFSRYFSTVTGKSAQPNARTKFVSHYTIPDSDGYLEFMFYKKSIEVRRKKR